MNNIDDSYGQIGMLSQSVFEKYLKLDWRQLPLSAKDYFTDIITFDYTDSEIPSSDIFISIDRVADNADTFKKPFINELYRIIFHGILHLVGYKDKEPDDKLLMTQKEDHYLTILQDSE